VVSPHYRGTFTRLVLLVGASVALGVTWNVFTGCVEGFQRFDVSSRIGIVSMGARSAGIAVLLALGFGLVEMGAIALLSQFLSFLLYFIAFRKLYAPLEFSTRHVKWSMLQQTAKYGLHTFVATIGSLTVEQGPSIVIARLLPVAYVGYYALPLRLLQYVADMVGRAGLVVAPRAAELAAMGRTGEISKLAASVNRYCLALFMPLAIVLVTDGGLVVRLWVGEEFARQSAPLLPWFVVGIGFSLGAQYTSGSVLFGLGKHSRYAWALLVEALLSVAGMLWLIPKFGIIAAALLASALMVLNRGLLTPWLVCNALNCGFWPYMRSILTAPLLTSVPVFGLAYWLTFSVLPASTWLHILVLAAVVGGTYYCMAFMTCLEKEHRSAVLAWLSRHSGI